MDRCHSLGKNLNLSAPKLCNGDLPLSYLRHCAEYVVIIINSVVFLASNSSSEKLLQLQCGHNIKQSDTVTGGWEVTTTDTTCWLAAHRDEGLRLIKASRSLEGQERAVDENHMQSPRVYNRRASMSSSRKAKKKSKSSLPLLPMSATPKPICTCFCTYTHIFKPEPLHHNHNNKNLSLCR